VALCLLAPAAAQEREGAINFDIPAEPLAQALGAYSTATGQAVLVDDGLIPGRSSAAIRGRLAPGEALRTLLQGTGLAARYVTAMSFTLVPAPERRSERPPAAATARAGAGDYRSYFAAIQSSLKAALCRQAQTRPGQYRVGVRLWVGRSGIVTHAELLSSTGDRARDVVLAVVLNGITIDEPPPVNLPQPVTVVLARQSPENPADCSRADRDGQ
jgi:hypothetical protein